MAIELQVQGEKNIMRVFNALPGAIQRRIYRPTFAASASAIVRAARQNLVKNKSIRSGLLRKSLGSVVRIMRNGTVVAYVGPRRSVRGSYGKRNVEPWRYAHLVERGGRGGKMPASPFLGPAFESNKNEAFQAARRKFEQRLSAEVEKLSRIHKSIVRA